MRKEGKMRIRMGYEMVMGYDVDMGCYFLERFSEYGYLENRLFLNVLW